MTGRVLAFAVASDRCVCGLPRAAHRLVRESLAAVERGMTPPRVAASGDLGAPVLLERVEVSPFVIGQLVTSCAVLDVLSARPH